MNIYVGNLAPDTTEEELRQAFAKYGQVVSAKIVKDRYTFESRGFGFVEVPNKAQAMEAMAELNGTELGGNILRVNEARPRRERSGGHRGGNGGDRRW